MVKLIDFFSFLCFEIFEAFGQVFHNIIKRMVPLVDLNTTIDKFPTWYSVL